MNVCTDSSGKIVSASQDGSPTPPAGGSFYELTPAQLDTLRTLNETPNGGVLFDGDVFAALPHVAPVPFDYSNLDNLDRVLKALGLLLRDYTNALQAGTYTTKTINQLKADFASKYNALGS